jgi:hypothetical protein
MRDVIIRGCLGIAVLASIWSDHDVFKLIASCILLIVTVTLIYTASP